MTTIKHLLTPLLAVVLLLATAVVCGCGKSVPATPPAPQSRMDDPAYRQQLKDSKARQDKEQRVLVRASEKMQRYIERARAALPKGATDEQIERELNTNPTKYPGWAYLQREFRQAEARREKELADLRRTVRQRIMKEAAAQAAAQGTAGAKPAPKK